MKIHTPIMKVNHSKLTHSKFKIKLNHPPPNTNSITWSVFSSPS